MSTKAALAMKRFVERAKQLRQVQAIAVDAKDSDAARVWVVLAAPPFEDEYRKPIYELQREILSGTQADLDFRVVNSRELPSERSPLLPANSTVLYQAT